MQSIIETEVLVIGEGSAGLTAALAAHERGANVTMLYSEQASSTAISTGFVTYAAHDGFKQDEVLDAMANTTGKGLCDMPLLERLVREAPLEMAEAIEKYEIPVDKAPRGYRVRRSTGRRGKDLSKTRLTEYDNSISMPSATTTSTRSSFGQQAVIRETECNRQISTPSKRNRHAIKLHKRRKLEFIMTAVNLNDKLATFSEYWSPKIVANFNGHDVMVVKVKGEFNWHSHSDTDDFFLVLKGQITIKLRDRDIHLREGEMFVVPKGVEHCPVAQEEAHLLLIEPHGTPNTGDEATAVKKVPI